MISCAVWTIVWEAGQAMGKELLSLYLDGPLQSWGLRARWDVRDTGNEPSKSGIVGLLGCALGYPTQDPRLQELDEQLRMGVRVERAGTALVDFQTVSGMMMAADGGFRGRPDDPHTIISPRSYLQDAAFLVVLDGAQSLLRRCAAALQRPRWPIYLGRKACVPTRPVFHGLSDRYASIGDALTRHPWESRYEGEMPPERLRCVVEDRQGTHIRPDRLVVNPARMYQYRAVRVFWIDLPEESVKEPIPQGGSA
jgi:CRISPR system Cascade subunit CasD